VITQFVVGEFFLKFPPPLLFFSFFKVKKKKNGSFEINDFGFTTLFCVVSKKSLVVGFG
jgi:hypothetical protein